MTYEEAMKRLMAIEPLPVGERLARWRDGYKFGPHYVCLWYRLARNEPRRDLWSRDIRIYARPLRHARERAKIEAVGRALLEFFTDLSILVRNTPAPCPWCGAEAFDYWSYDDYPDVVCSAGDHRASLVGSMPSYDIVEMWNRVAVPAAYRRLT